MKKIALFICFICLLLGCGDEEKKSQVPDTKIVIPYDYYQERANSVKLQGIVSLNLFENNLPTEEQLKNIAEDLIMKNPDYENYFFTFKFPFTQKRPEKDANNFQLYYNINKLGKNDFEIQALYPQMKYYNLTLSKNIIGKLGINQISNITPIKVGTSLNEIFFKLGNPSEKKDNTYIYYIVNNRNQTFGTLYLEENDSKISNVAFYSNNLNFDENQLSQIEKYIAGDISLSDLKIKEIDDIYPFSISIKQFPERLNYSRLSMGDIDNVDYLEKVNKTTVDFIIPAKQKNYVKYTFDIKSQNLSKVTIVSEDNTDENYEKFLSDMSRTFLVLDPECNFLRINSTILSKLNFLYDNFVNSKNYKASILMGKYKIDLQKNKAKVILNISENKD